MRQNIIEILTALGNGEKPFYEQDNLPKKEQELCLLKLAETNDIVLLNDFFDKKISDIIFHSHNMYLAYR